MPVHEELISVEVVDRPSVKSGGEQPARKDGCGCCAQGGCCSQQPERELRDENNELIRVNIPVYGTCCASGLARSGVDSSDYERLPIELRESGLDLDDGTCVCGCLSLHV